MLPGHHSKFSTQVPNDNVRYIVHTTKSTKNKTNISSKGFCGGNIPIPERNKIEEIREFKLELRGDH